MIRRIFLALLFLVALGALPASAAGCTGTGSCFWEGGTGNTSDTTKWCTTDTNPCSGSTGGLPGTTDNCNFTANSNSTAYTVTADISVACKDMTWALPATSGVPTFAGSSNLQVFGNLTNVTGMLWTFSGGTLIFSATATGKTITNAGVTYNTTILFNGVGGGWTLQDDLISGAARTLTVTNGSLNTNGKTVTCGFFASTSGVRTWIFGGSQFNISAITSGTPWNVSTTGTLTVTSIPTAINFTGGAANTAFTVTPSTSPTYLAMNFTGPAGAGLPGNWTMNNSPVKVTNFTYLSSTDKRDSFAGMGWTIQAGGSISINGNSVVNRAFIKPLTIGVAETPSVPTGATVTLNNVDFQDIQPTGTFGTWTGTSLGDALGNSGITFDGSATQTLVATGTISWSTAANWTSRVPLPQDDVTLPVLAPATTLTVDMPRMGRNLDASAFNKTLQFNQITNSLFGNITLGASSTLLGTQTLTLQGRGAQTITSNGKTFPQAITVQAFGGTYTQQDNFSCGTSQYTLSNGTWAMGAFDAASGNFISGGGLTRALTGSGTWSVSTASGTAWNITTPAGLTTSGFTGTIKFTGNNSTTQTFAGAGMTWPNFWWSNTAATGTLIITGANTFNDFRSDGTTARTVQFPASTTQVVSSFTVSGADASHKISLTSSSPGTAATLSKSSGSVSSRFLSIQDSTATGGAAWIACASTSVSGNTGWIFSCPGGGLPLTGVGELERRHRPANDNDRPLVFAARRAAR